MIWTRRKPKKAGWWWYRLVGEKPSVSCQDFSGAFSPSTVLALLQRLEEAERLLVDRDPQWQEMCRQQ